MRREVGTEAFFWGGNENGGVDAAQQTRMKKYTMLR